MQKAEFRLPVLGFATSSLSAVFFCATPSSVYYVYGLAFSKEYFQKQNKK